MSASWRNIRSSTRALSKKDKETASHMAKVHIDNQKKAIIRQIRLEREKNK